LRISPASERPKTFYLGRREYDLVCMGYQITATAAPKNNPNLRCLGDKTDSAAGEFDGGFRLDTTIRGNHNLGHEFSDEKKLGVIGRYLSSEERLALIEFLKTI
jgi:hypothetical protein